MMMTMGQALDAAVKLHEERHPQSAVYSAMLSLTETRNVWRVELRCEHFSTVQIYSIDATKEGA